MADTPQTYREHALLLGEARSLVGIQCVPATADAARPITVVILNSGIIHRVGANRMHVELARALAGMGFPTLRFDLSGLGDSLPRTDDLPLIDSVVADVRVAVDHLAAVRPGASFVLVGLCSGALHALVYGATDPRVKGLVLLDVLVPRTRGYWLRFLLSRLGSAAAWRRFLKRKSTRAKPVERTPDLPDLEQPEDLFPMDTAYAALGERFQIVVKRETEILAVFTAGLENQHNYARQLVDGYPAVNFGRQLALKYFHDTDHTFSSETDRGLLIRTIGSWLTSTPALQRVPALSTSDSGTVGVTESGIAESGVTESGVAESAEETPRAADSREDLEF